MAKQNGIGIGESKSQLFFQPIRMLAPVRVYDNYPSPLEFKCSLMREPLPNIAGVGVPEDTYKMRCEASYLLKHSHTGEVTAMNHPLRSPYCLLNASG